MYLYFISFQFNVVKKKEKIFVSSLFWPIVPNQKQMGWEALRFFIEPLVNERNDFVSEHLHLLSISSPPAWFHLLPNVFAFDDLPLC